MAKKLQPPSQPHPANCPGNFYVEEGCCITCGVPLDEAPEVFDWVEHGGLTSCVVVRQPETPESINRTLAAMRWGEVDCIRYRGNDPDIGRRLVEAGLGDQCDQEPPADAVVQVRSHVTFQAFERNKYADVAQLAQEFLLHFNHLSGLEHDGTLLEVSGDRAAVKISWWNSVYHIVEFSRHEDQRWLAITLPSIPAAGRGLSRVVDRWLKADGIFGEVRWYSGEQWKAGGPYLSTVI